MKSEPIIYSGFLVGWRDYKDDRFIGYRWDEETYQLYLKHQPEINIKKLLTRIG